MITLIPSSKDWRVRGVPTQSCSTLCYIETEGKVHPACHHSDQWQIPGEERELPVFALLRSLGVQSKNRLRQAAASGNQEEEQGKRRNKKVKDSGLEITRMDVEEVSTFKTGTQRSSLVSRCLII